MSEFGVVPEMIFAPMTVIFGELHSFSWAEASNKWLWSDVSLGQDQRFSLWAHVRLAGILGLLAEMWFDRLGRYWAVGHMTWSQHTSKIDHYRLTIYASWLSFISSSFLWCLNFYLVCKVNSCNTSPKLHTSNTCTLLWVISTQQS